MKIIKKLKGGFQPFLTEDEKLLSTTNSRNTAYVYNLEDRKLLYTVKTVSNISKTAISRDKKLLAAKNTSGTIAVISLENGEEICRSAMENREGYPMIFTPDGSSVMDFDWDGRTMLLDCTSGVHRILEGPERRAGNQLPFTPYMKYDAFSKQIYKFKSASMESLEGSVEISSADTEHIVFQEVQKFTPMMPESREGISFCRTNNYYMDRRNNQLVITDKNFSELSRKDLPERGIRPVNKIWVSAGEKYIFMDFGKQCDYRDFAAMKTAKSLSCIFALDTMEQVAEFDYDYVSDFLMFDDDQKFVLATWQGSYLGTMEDMQV